MRSSPAPQQQQFVSKHYSGITLQRWQAVIQAAHKFGIWIDEKEGQAETFGVRFKWQYNEPAQRLDVTILQAGFVGEVEALRFLDNIIANA